MKPEEIIKAYDARRQERRGVEQLWALIERFILPFGNRVFNELKTDLGMDWRSRDIYDSTGINSNQLLASNIQSSITNPVSKWANYMYSDPILKDDYEAQAWVEEVEQLTSESIKATNFNNEAGEFYLDLTSFAMGIQTQESFERDDTSFDKIAFDTVPPDEAVFDLDEWGYPRNFYRCMSFTLQQLIDKFGLEALPEGFAEKAKRVEKTHKKHKVILCYYLRPENKNVSTWEIQPVDKRPYGVKYVLKDEKKQVGETDGAYEMPASIARWRTVSGSNWGFCPSMIAIWDVLTLNQVTELVLKAGEKVIDPALLTTNRGVFGNIDLSAGGLTVVTDTNAVVPFESNARFDVSQLSKQELRQAIKDTYYWDQLQLKESPQMTAYEVQARIQLMQRLIGPTYGRLQTHYLDPTLERHMKILYRYGQLPQMPQIVMDRGGKLSVQYLGPLASAQRLDEVQNIESTLQSVAAISDRYEEAADNINIDNSVRELVQAKGAPVKMLRSKEEVKQIREQRAEQNAQRMQAENATMMGQAMQAGGQGLKAMGEADAA